MEKFPGHKKVRSLSDLRLGEMAVLEHIDLEEEDSQRLMELGFLPGTKILARRPAPGGDPMVFQVEGSEITTIAGLAEDQELEPLRHAFSHHGALQCGFCTPGVLISTSQFLATHKNPSEAEVRDMLSGHLCRCTGYEGMVKAILEVAGQKTQAVCK